MHQPHGRYFYTHNLTSTIFGTKDETVVLAYDMECEVDIEVNLSSDGFDLDAYCCDVLIDGLSLKDGDELAKLVRLQVMQAVDDELDQGGPIWDEVALAEGLSLSGHAGDPDTHWVRN